MDYIEVSAKTIEEATSQATAQIESQGRVVTSVKVLEEPSKGFLGFGNYYRNNSRHCGNSGN